MLTAACLLLLFTCSLAQNDSTDRPNTCLQTNICNYQLDDLNMPYPNIDISDLKSYAKNTPVDYPGDVSYKNENNGRCTNSLPNNVSKYCYDNTDALVYTAYYPKPKTTSNPNGYAYAQCPLPAVVFVHGGGFSDCVNEEADPIICTYFAQKGFVAFNVSYRTGVKLVPNSFAGDYVSVQQQLAVYRAGQDIRGFLRSIIKAQFLRSTLPSAQRTPYQINTDFIFLAGNSAGAITILNVAYYDTQQMVDDINPYTGTNSISDALGPIDADFYYGEPNVSNYDYRGKIAGVLGEWGSVSLPPAYTNNTAKNFFANTHVPPAILFYGKNDHTVEPGIEPVKFAAPTSTDQQLQPYYSENTCLLKPSFKTNNDQNTVDAKTFGSQAFFDYVLQPLNIPSEIYSDCQMAHGLDCDPSSPKCTTPFQSDFGTCYKTPDEVTRYIAGRAAVFFQNIISNNAQTRQNLSTVHKVFIDCRNDYNACNSSNNDNGCTTNRQCQSYEIQCPQP